jgi:hypothetical protein
MTEHQRHLFGKILDLNWEIQCGAHNPRLTEMLQNYMDKLELEMVQDMGLEAWENFKEKGRRMFSPA